MGIDWIRFQIKPEVDLNQLKDLIEQQALAFQSVSGWYETNSDGQLTYNLMKAIHWDTYQNASNAIEELLIFPEWDEEHNCEADFPDLSLCFRVYPVRNNELFPPLWRVKACRTFLPEELTKQLSQWKQWVDEVLCGIHDEYLRKLHLYETLDSMRYHQSILRGYAIASLAKNTSWAEKTELDEVRQEIFKLSEPFPYEVAIEPSQKDSLQKDKFEEIYRRTMEDILTLIQLTRQWDSKVRGKWKIRYYESCYCLTLEEFRELAEDNLLQEFFKWVGRCVELGFGLFLDY